MTMTHQWLTWALLSAGFAALTAIFAKLGVQDIDSDLATLIRTALVFLLLIPIVWLGGKWSNPLILPGRSLVFLALSAIATGASWLCYFRALQLGNASQVAPIDKTSVILVAILAWLLLGERPSPREWMGIGLIGAGLLMMAWPHAPAGNT